MTMNKFLFSMVILISFFIRFFYLGIIPEENHLTSYGLRIMSSIENIGVLIMLYFITRRLIRNEAISLLSSFIFGTLPWTIEQSRIASEVNNFLFWFIFLLTIAINSRLKFIKVMAIVLIPLFLYLTYPSFWLLKINLYSFNLNNFINSIFLLTSFELLFFRNITFWWGGVREWGALHISFIPFLLVGIFQLLVKRIIYLIISIILILIISALSPYLPESREFYIVTPFLSVILALGILYFFRNDSIIKYRYPAIIIFVLVFIYDFSSLLHYYFVHYSQQVIGNIQNIHGIF